MQTPAQEPRPSRAVAVIGMACRFPGAPDIAAYWRLLAEGRSGIVETDPADLRAAGIPGRVLGGSGLVTRFGVLDQVAAFDARAFRMPPARASALDPQQRLLLELAVTALEDAGYVGERDAGSVGVYCSLGPCSYRGGEGDDGAGGFFALTASDKDYGATRISYALDLTGPCMTVQSACSGSLAAVHMAVEALLSGQCDIALAGGASITLPQGAYRAAPGLMLAPDGRCRPFDAAASGTVPGNGAGLVVLKPLEQALADDDRIDAVVLGSAVANDGARKVDYLAPGIRGQMRALGEAWSVAGIRPASLGMIEAHGTGTAIGDPIEIRALAQLFAHFAARGEPPPSACRIGSVKANIGHLNVASGIAGLIKTVLALREGVIPGTPGFRRPNPQAPFADTPLRVNPDAAPWPEGRPRRAGVSSFGFGGTNVHLVLEAAAPRRPKADHASGALLLPLSAHDEAGLERLRRALARHLEGHPDLDLEDVAYTLQRGRADRPVRALVRAAERDQALALLNAAGPLPAADTGSGPASAWIAGEPAAWEPSAGRRIALPTYPFARDTHWIDQQPCYPLGVSPPAPGEPAALASEQGRTEAAPATPVPDPVVSPTREGLLTWLRGLFAHALQRNDRLAEDATYDSFGVDSLLIVSLTGRIRERYPEVRSSLLFEHTTLGALTDHLLEAYPAAAATPGSATPPGAVPATPPLPAPRAESDGAMPIAVIGLAGRFPGAADPEELWRLLEQGRCAVGPVPADRGWPEETDLPRRRAGFIDGIDRFDALFFGVSPTEARRMDPQARLFLETAWAALEDAGTPRAELRAAARRAAGAEADVGVFVGVMNMPYRLLAPEADAAGQVVQANHWSVANRVSYHFDFTGPSMAVDTACSASLTALHLACESLRRGECGAALAGGVNLILDPVQQRELIRMGMLSPTDTCRAFGEGADGFVQGEGVGAVVLKPLAAAVADGDRVLGTLIGGAVNANGRTGGYTVPSPTAQTAVIRRAIDQARVPGASISAVECHGTGTALGDPIEISGLADALGETGGGLGHAVRIGSIKSNMGHLESAAGMAGLAKVLLQLRHRRLAPSLHAGAVNPELGLEGTALQVIREASPWSPESDPEGRPWPLRAGLSGFGAGGSNAHLILQEAPLSPAGDPPRLQSQPILLSAADPDALLRLRDRLRERLVQESALAGDLVGLADLAFSLATGREALAVRRGFLARDRAALLRGLEDLAIPGSDAWDPAGATDSDQEPARLLALWVSGGAVDWARLWAGERRRRIGLPTYPFAGPRLWLGDRPEHESDPLTPPRPGLRCPLVGTQGTTDPANRSLRIDSAMALIDQHRVRGLGLMPGVASLTAALAATEAAGWPVAGAADVVWRRPVEPGPDGMDLRVELSPAAEGRGFRVTAGGDALLEGRTIPGAAGDWTPEARIPGLDEVAGRLPLELDRDQVHTRLASVGLDHGPALRAIRRIRVNAEEAVAELQRPPEAGRAFAGWHPCPALLDSALQTACMVLLTSPGSLLPLPLGVERIELAKDPLPDILRVQARLLSRGHRYARMDLLIGDGEGRPLVRMQGLTARLLPEEAPAAADPVPLFAPRWRPEPRTPSPSPLIPAGAVVALIAPEPRGPLAEAAVAALSGHRVRQVAPEALPDLVRSDPPGVLVYVHPEEPEPSDPPHALTLLGVLQALAASNRPATLILLTRRVHSILPEDRAQPWAAAAIGLARTAMQELDGLTVACLDLDDPATLAQALDDAPDPLGLPLAWRKGQRLVLRLQRLDAESAAAVDPLGPGDHLLILGGAGGIGRALAARWGGRHAARITLIGRRAATALSPGPPPGTLYLQADITDLADLRAAIAAAEEGQGPVTAAVHAALVMDDRSIRNMEPETFLGAMEVKRLGMHHLHLCLEGRGLRWLCAFSSVNSFAANGGQSNYVAGCAVKDALCLALAHQSRFPVRIVNWGYWGEVGRVASDAYRRRMQEAGVGAIGTDEGLDALERILAGTEPQVLALRAEPAVLERLGLDLNPDLDTAEGSPPPADLLTAAETAARRDSAASRDAMAGAAGEYRDLDRVAGLALGHWWQDQGLLPDPGETLEAEALAQRLGLAPEHRRQFEALLDLLTRQGILAREGTALTRGALAPAGEPAQERHALLSRAPAFAPHFRLLEACLARYGEVLRGETPATQVLFPDMSMSLVEAMYRGNRMVDHFNRGLAASAAALARQALAEGRRLRVLEFGAGTGGTTRQVLPALAAVGTDVEYDYTDISPGFLLHGRQQFADDYPFVRFRTYDLEQAPDPAVFPPGAYDLVLGANAIHATRRLGDSLDHVSRLLRPGGLLMLYEMVAPHDFVTITFGLLPGWWLYQDRRLPHGPLLDPAGWRGVLAEGGFDAVRILGEPEARGEADATHALILARRPPAPAQVQAADDAPATPPAPRQPLLRGRLRGRGGAPNREAGARPGDAGSGDTAALEAAVLACVAETLEIPAARLDAGRSLAEYGADSILGVELVGSLNRRFGVTLRPTTLFSHPSVAAIARHLARDHGIGAPASGTEPAALSRPAESPATAPESPPAHAIAVIGMAGRFPGAGDIDAFEDLLMDGRCSVRPVPAERWDHGLIHDPRPLTPGRSVCPEGGFLDDVADFDPAFFELSPAEATAMDPQQRLFLTACWHAVEDAGLAPEALRGSRCGVYAGNVAADYGQLLEIAGRPPDAHSFMGTAPSMLPARIAYLLDIKGPAMSIDTACSSSLVAIAEACEALGSGRCELALAGGVAVMSTPGFYVVASNAGMLSPGGRCRTLDAGADGFVPGEACGVLVLKRLDRALADRDRVLGVIRGWGSNQDGTSNGITAPSAPAQAELIRAAQGHAGVPPESIDYVELHGTGTRLGDPVEIEGLGAAFGAGGACGIGSVKSNLGHTLAAAGAVGVIKVLLALRRGELPPTLHLERLNPDLGLADTPFRPVRSNTPWPVTPGRPRRAGVSAFGFSGTNAHLILEEAPPPPVPPGQEPPWLFVLSARSPRALAARAADLGAWLERHPDVSPGALAATLGAGRRHFRERAALVTEDPAALRARLAELAAGDPTGWQRGSGADPAPTREAVAEAVERAVAGSRGQRTEGAARLARLYAQGGEIPFPVLQGPVRPVPLALPGYPFENRRCWPDVDPRRVALAAGGTNTQRVVPPRPAVSVLTAVTDHLDRLTAQTRKASR